MGIYFISDTILDIFSAQKSQMNLLWVEIHQTWVLEKYFDTIASYTKELTS